jgi:cbb3-type cytochrome c oxidase subunit III
MAWQLIYLLRLQIIMHIHQTSSLENKRRTKKLPGCILAALLLASTTSVLAGQHNKTPGAVRTGASLYHDYCSVCHGDKGDGQSRARNSFAVPPRNYTTPEAAIELTRERMIHSVTHGRPGTAMIAWGGELSKQEIETVVDYVRATFMKLGGETKDRARPSEKLLSSRGGVLYMQACVMCHGDTGVRQISGRMQPPPRDFASPVVIAELTRKRMIASVTNGRPGTAMRPYGDQFSQGDIEAMVDFIREAFMSNASKK